MTAPVGSWGRTGLLFAASLLVVALTALCAARAQEVDRLSDPTAALSAALNAACRANGSEFATYLTSDNAVAFRSLPDEQRAALLKRFSLTEGAGKTLTSSDMQGRPVLRCQSPGQTVEFRFGEVRTRENLAFVAVSVADSQQTQFGLIRENGAWRLLSLGLVLLDIPELSKQWSLQDLTDREAAAMANLDQLANAIHAYRRSFGKLPDSLAQLGPARRDQISPEQASLLEAPLSEGMAGGYHFHYRILSSDPTSDADAIFELEAAPDEYPKKGQRSFLLDRAGQIHGADKHGAAAASSDPLIAGEKAP